MKVGDLVRLKDLATHEPNLLWHVIAADEEGMVTVQWWDDTFLSQPSIEKSINLALVCEGEKGVI